jgi:hypothetical protein
MAYTYLVKTDLYTHIYPEKIDEITRQAQADPGYPYGDALVTDAIDSAIQKAQAYLNRYDVIALFGTPDGVTAATFTDSSLKRIVKDITCWELLTLCNTNINLEVFDIKNKAAIRYLKDIQCGDEQPNGWPVYNATNNPPNIGDSIAVRTNHPRHNHY